MNWHYLDGSTQRGPVTEADLDGLIQAGSVGNDTLVWREGMAEWQPLRSARGAVAAATPKYATATASAGDVFCTECGGAFPADQVIRHGNSYICASCKPVFLQKLKEGVAPVGTLNYAGFWIRFCAKVVDVIIMDAIAIPLGMVLAPVVGPISGLAGLVIAVTYTTFFLGKFGATPGKMATKLRVVNPDGSAVSYGKAFGRYFGEMVSGLVLGIGYLLVISDPEKRALHDRICSTRVIRR